MRQLHVQLRDLQVLTLAENRECFMQGEVPWEASYQSKMRRLRKLCKSGLLKMVMEDRRRPNTYYLTEKGRNVLCMKRVLLNVKPSM